MTRSRPTTPSRRQRLAARRGVTLLEAVFATVLLGMAATTIVGVSSALRKNFERQQQLLGAAEMANRLMLIFRDDPRDLPPQTRPAWYGPADSEFGWSYRWSLTEAPVSVEMSEHAREASQTSGPDTIQFSKRMRVIRIDVWLSEESGGSVRRGQGVPECSISRLVDPLAFTNNDRDQRALEREGVESFLSNIIGTLGSSESGGGTRTLGTESGDDP